MHMICLGVPRNFAKAHKWFTLAGAEDIEALSNKKFVEKRLTPEQVSKSKRFASEWRQTFPNKYVRRYRSYLGILFSHFLLIQLSIELKLTQV